MTADWVEASIERTTGWTIWGYVILVFVFTAAKIPDPAAELFAPATVVAMGYFLLYCLVLIVMVGWATDRADPIDRIVNWRGAGSD